VDEKALLGLIGVLRTTRKVFAGRTCLDLAGFAPSSEWELISKDARGDSWDRLLHQGVHLLQKFTQDDRVQVRRPKENLQVKMLRALNGNNEFVAYIEGELDGKASLIDWKTTTSRYPEGPEGLLALDPQMICYSWISGIRDVALVVFIRKSIPELQYLKTSITEEQCREYGRLVEGTVRQIESGQFPPHCGIRFPNNGCVGCPHLGLCLGDQQMVDSRLIRRPGATDLDWLDAFDD